MAKLQNSFSALFFIALLIFANEVNAYAPSSGRVPIKKDSNGYYVEVDYVANPSSAADTGKWILSLVNSKTIIGGSYCLKFNGNGCSRNNCKNPATTQTDLVDPYFTAKGKKVTAELYLDHKYWASKENAYLTDSCSSNLASWVGYSREGIIGLSQDSLGDRNYVYPYKNGDGTIFQISMYRDLSGGMLTFYKDNTYAGYNTLPIIADTSDGSMWRTQTMYCGVTFPNSANKFMAAKVMFDPFSDIITLPPDMLTFIVNTLSQYGASCSSSRVRPTCSYNNYISKLPKLTIKLGDSTFPLPPSVYLKEFTEYQSTITLNIKGADPSVSGEGYIHTNFKNHIIFNDKFMSNYNIVFKQKEIQLYFAPEPVEPKPEPKPADPPKPVDPVKPIDPPKPAENSKPDPKKPEEKKASAAAINPLIPLAVVLVIVIAISICIKMKQQKAATVLTQSLARASFSEEDPASPQKPFIHQQTFSPQQTSPPQIPPQQNYNYNYNQNFNKQQVPIPQQNYPQQVYPGQQAYPQQAYIPPQTSPQRNPPQQQAPAPQQIHNQQAQAPAPQQNFNPEHYFAPQNAAPQLNFAQHSNPFHPSQ